MTKLKPAKAFEANMTPAPLRAQIPTETRAVPNDQNDPEPTACRILPRKHQKVSISTFKTLFPSNYCKPQTSHSSKHQMFELTAASRRRCLPQTTPSTTLETSTSIKSRRTNPTWMCSPLAMWLQRTRCWRVQWAELLVPDTRWSCWEAITGNWNTENAAHTAPYINNSYLKTVLHTQPCYWISGRPRPAVSWPVCHLGWCTCRCKHTHELSIREPPRPACVVHVEGAARQGEEEEQVSPTHSPARRHFAVAELSMK